MFNIKQPLMKTRALLFTLFILLNFSTHAVFIDDSLSESCILSPHVQYRGQDNGYFFPNKVVGISTVSVCVYKDAYGQRYNQGKLVKGLKEGVWNKWYENGQKMREENYKNGKLEGTSKGWLKYGKQRSEENYKNGLAVGIHVTWEKNYRIEKSYKNNKLDGRWVQFNKDESLVESRMYKSGNKIGTWYYFNDGSEFSAVFKNGKCVNSKPTLRFLLQYKGEEHIELKKFIANMTIEKEWGCPPIE